MNISGEEGTLQQVFLSTDAVSDNTYLSEPFGKLLTLEFSGGETKDPLPLLQALRNDPLNVVKKCVKQNDPQEDARFIDALQARLLWNPKDIAESKIIIETVELFDLTDLNPLDKEGKEKKVVDLKKQMKKAKQELESLIIEDLGDWVKFADLEEPQKKIQGKDVKTPLPLLQLKKYALQ